MIDLLVRGGTVLDGTGAPGVPRDVAINGGRILAVEPHLPLEAKTVVCAEGKLVTPGFVDIHRHGDGALFRPDFGDAELYQGITTIVNGNCGMSPAPCGKGNGEALAAYLLPVLGRLPTQWQTMGEYLDLVERTPLPLNVGELAGMGTLRTAVCGYGGSLLSGEEKTALRRGLEDALSQGAIGVSLGLGYAPECFSPEEELTELLRPLEGAGIPVAVHLRQEGARVTEAAAEMLRVAKALRLPLEISHLKAIGTFHRGKTPKVLVDMLERARQEGVDAACDVYPYGAGSTQLTHVLPPEYKAGGVAGICGALADPEARKNIRERMETGTDFENIYALVGFEHIRVIGAADPAIEGKTVAELARERGQDGFTCLFGLLESSRCGLGMIDEIVAQEDLETLYRWHMTSVISDSTYPERGLCHPRVYGAFPNFWRSFAVEKPVLTPEEAVRRMSSLPAARMGLRTKGILAPGMDGDVLVLEAGKLAPRAVYAAPRRNAVGICFAAVNGVPVIENGVRTRARPGKCLRRRG